MRRASYHFSLSRRLLLACYSGDDKALLAVLDEGADVNSASDEDDITGLMEAAQRGFVSCLHILLNRGAMVNLVDKKGWSAATWAAFKGHTQCLDLLLDAGSRANTCDSDGLTPLMASAAGNNIDCMRLLLAYGAKVDLADDSGKTALFRPAVRGHVEALRILLDYGATVDAGDKDGQTPLFAAAHAGRAECVRLLIEHGAAVPSAEHGELEAAFAEGDSECLEVLRCNAAYFTARRRQRMQQRRAWTEKERPSLPNKVQSQLPTDTPAEAFFPPPTLPSTPLSSLASLNIDDDFGAAAVPIQTPSPAAPYAPVRPSPSPCSAPTLDLSSHAQRAPLPRSWAILYSELHIDELLGTGAYTKVYAATWNGTEVAVKMFCLPGNDGASEAAFAASLLSKFRAEGGLLAALRHPHCVAFLGVTEAPPCLVTERCARGSLCEMLKRAKIDPVAAAQLTWCRRLRMVADAAAGMAHLHQQSPQILHRDLKAANLLVDESYRVKVGDLGLGRLLGEATAEAGSSCTAASADQRWLAGEVMESGEWGPASDVYAFGTTLYELLTFDTPWKHLKSAFMIAPAVLRGDQLPVPQQDALPGPAPKCDATLQRYKNLMKRCMAREPCQRPGFIEVAQDLNQMLAEENAAAKKSSTLKTSSSREEALCVVCLEKPCTAALAHTKDKEIHRCCCDECAAALQAAGQPCPMCRRSFEIMRIF